MKRAIVSIAALFLASCESVPIAASYAGAGLGHEYTLAYSTKTGAAAVVNQK